MKTRLHYNPEQHVLPNATYANNGDELVAVIREQIKQGADFIKIYETGHDFVKDGQFHSIVQYSEPQLAQAVAEAARLQTRVAVHCEGEPGGLYAAQAGVASIDHADQLSDETMRLMHERQIYAVPTFTIQEYFAEHANSPRGAAEERWLLDYHAQEFKRQLAHGRAHGRRIRCRSFSPRHPGARAGIDGQVWDEARRGAPGGPDQRRPPARLGA